MKDRRQNRIDEKFELFRSIIGLEDTRDILDLYCYTGTRMTDPIQKDMQTVTDINYVPSGSRKNKVIEWKSNKAISWQVG